MTYKAPAWAKPLGGRDESVPVYTPDVPVKLTPVDLPGEPSWEGPEGLSYWLGQEFGPATTLEYDGLGYRLSITVIVGTGTAEEVIADIAERLVVFGYNRIPVGLLTELWILPMGQARRRVH